jgi:hypothetical protein
MSPCENNFKYSGSVTFQNDYGELHFPALKELS